jgi:hypothetical protein
MLLRKGGFLAFLLLAAAMTACSQGWGHTESNVPDPKDFDAILKRDLTAYVTDKNDKDISVSYELLRDRPTQSGVALPKFYVWIEKRDANGNVMEVAAARIAAIDKKKFEVIQYYAKDRILKEPDLIKRIFPDDVAAKIFKKVGLSGK